MDINQIINLNLITVDLKATNKKECINELVDLLEKEKRITDKKSIIEALEYRESLASTYCGFEMAIPHGISSSVIKPTLCFGRSNGFYWEEDDDIVKFIFMIVVPMDNQNNEDEPKHIEILSKVAGLGLNDEIREAWEKASTSNEILSSIVDSVNN